MPFVPNPAAWGLINKGISDAMKSASTTMAYRLRDNLKRGARRGYHYSKYPAQSSAAGEYPQEQFGSLRQSVDNRKSASRVLLHGWDVGFFGEDMKKLIELELKPWNGRRKPLTMLAENPETRREMAEAIERNDFV